MGEVHLFLYKPLGFVWADNWFDDIIYIEDMLFWTLIAELLNSIAPFLLLWTSKFDKLTFFPVHVLVWVRVWLPEESIISSRSRSVGFRHLDALLPLILFVWLFPGVCTTERGIEYRLQVHSWYLFHVTQDKLFGFLPLFWTDLLLFGYE